MIMSVTIWLAHSMTDRIIKLNTRLYDPVRHGMSYPDSDGHDHKTMTDRIINCPSWFYDPVRCYLDSSFHDGQDHGQDHKLSDMVL